MKILVIAAHPDDEVYGMGGTIAKLSNQGHEVYVLIVTDGSTSQYRGNENLENIIRQKKNEIEFANRILGVKKVFFGNLPDMKLDTVPHIEINKVIEDTLKTIEPKIVYTHFYGDVNLDHKNVYKSTLVAVRPLSKQCVKEIYCYNVPSSTEWSPQITSEIFMPNTIIDISKYSQVKFEAIRTYKSEIRQYPHPRSVEHVEKLDVVTGLKYGLKAAEEFMLLRKIL